MVEHDFVVLEYINNTKNVDTIKHKITVEKMPIKNNSILLSDFIKQFNVSDTDFALAVEQLDGLPIRQKGVYIVSDNVERILIEQI